MRIEVVKRKESRLAKEKRQADLKAKIANKNRMGGAHTQVLNPSKPVTFTMDSYGGVLNTRKVNADKLPDMQKDPIEIQVLANKSKSKKKKQETPKGVISGETTVAPGGAETIAATK